MVQHIQPLVETVDAFLAEHDMSPVTFGRLALRDPHFVRQLRNGRRTWPETEEKVRTFMDAYERQDAPPPFVQAGGEKVALCGACDRRAEDPEVSRCTVITCPMREREAA